MKNMSSPKSIASSSRNYFGVAAREGVKLLYKSFSNYLLLGQWELARACLSQLSKQCQLTDIDIKDVLQRVAEYPFNVSLGSNAVSNPNELSWLCLLELKQLQNSSENQEDDGLHFVAKETNFRLLLTETCQNADAEIIKEIYLWFKYINSKTVPAKAPGLSRSTLTHIQSVLLSSPTKGYVFISSLSPLNRQEKQSGTDQRTNESLQLLYISCINILLDGLSKCSSKERAKCEQICEEIYVLLSFYDPVPYWNYSQLQQLFVRLLKMCKTGSWLKKDRVISTLLGRKCPYLVETFCKLDHENSLSTKSKSAGTEALSSHQKDVVHLLQQDDHESCWQNLFLLTSQRQRHFLELILDTALSLIRCEQFAELGTLLQPAELQPMKPVVLLLGWSLCKTSSVARQLLDTLWDEKTPCRHPALTAGCRKLAYQIELIQWCLDRTKPLLESSGIGVSKHERATHLLQGLEAHSVLFVLHQSTTLASLDQREVLELLQNTVKRQGSESQRKKKSVRFQLSEDQNGKPELEASEDISIEQQRDLCIYRSFCAIRNIMDVIDFCSQNSDLELMNPVCVKKTPRPSSLSRSFTCDTNTTSSEGEDSCGQDLSRSLSGNFTSVSSASFEVLYDEYVTQKLKDTQNHIKKLHPLTYRVEVLEDIFSLLFSTHQDVQECSTTQDFDSDEGAEDSSKRNSQENMSLNTSLMSEEDMTSPLVQKTNFFEENVPVLSSQSVPTLGYDEPFQELPALRVSQSLHKKVCIPKDQLAEQIKESSNGGDKTKPSPTGRTSRGSIYALDFTPTFKLGFLANEYVVRDVLAMMKDCLLDLNAIRAKLKSEKSDECDKLQKSDVAHITFALEESLCLFVKSSVTPDTLQMRLTRLTQYIHEAQWRFQLVSHDQLPKQPGHLLQKPVFVMGDENFDVVHSENWKRSKSPNKDRRSVSSLNSGDNDTPDGTGDVDLRFRRLSLKSSQRPRQALPTRHEIIPLMLSTPETLLIMSLSKGNFAQASQVIKLFKLETTEAAEEVAFSELYKKATHDLLLLESSSKQTGGATGQPGRLSMKALANVAAAGVASSTLSNVTDNLLSAKTLAKLPTPNTRSNLPDPVMRLCSEIDYKSAMLLDLLCTSCKTWDLCNNMFDIIKTTVSLDSEAVGRPDAANKKPKTEIKLKGALPFLKQMELFVQSIMDKHKKLNGATFIHFNLQAQLRSATCPLVADKLNSYCGIYDEIRHWVEKTTNSFDSWIGMDIGDSQSSLDVSPSASPGVSPSESVTKVKVIAAKVSGLHNVYKHFTSTVVKCVPTGGIVFLLKRHGCESSYDKNYLYSLYEHIRELAVLVAECERKSKEGNLLNYFQQLEEGPIITLGRLIFAKKMVPARLENVAQKLSLNLTHIIVHSCCPRIPSKHLPPLQIPRLNHDCEMLGPRIIYNSGSPSTPSDDPEKLVRELLDQMRRLMQDTASNLNARSIFDSACAKHTLKSEEYRNVLSSTSRLQTLDLNLLKTREQLLCFYSNLQNLMMIHLYLHNIWQRTLNQIQSDDQSAGDFTLISTIDSLVHLGQFAYRIGQLGVISLFELKYVLCRIGLSPPTSWKGLVSPKNLDNRDSWMKYAPPLEARLLYVLSDGCLSSPPIQVLHPDTVDAQLEDAMVNYLTHTIHVELASKKVTIPALLSWYKQDFSHSDNTDASVEGLLHVISANMGGTTGEHLQQLLDADSLSSHTGYQVSSKQAMILTVSEYIFDFSFVFEMPSVSQDTSQSSIYGSMSPPQGLDTSMDSLLDRSDQGFLVEIPTYQLTPLTLDYVKMDSVLVATMVSLVCADELDDIEEHLQDDHFESSSIKSRTTSMSDISLVDIRSYRYQRLMDDFPILQRHLLNYIIPLAAADNPEIFKSSDQVLKFVTNDIDDNVKTCMFSLHDSLQFQRVVLEIINRLVLAGKWMCILLILKSIPETTMTERREWQILHDYVLGCWAEQESEENPDNPDIVNNLRQFFSCDAHARIALSVCSRLKVNHGIDLLESCLAELLSGDLRLAVEARLTKLQIYQKITDSVKNLQFKLSKKTSEFVRMEEMESARKYHSALEKFTDWRKVVTCSITSPQEVLAVLLRTGDFEIIRSWSSLHSISHKLKMDIEERHLVSLLSSEKPNTAKAFQILEQVQKTDPSTCVKICDSLLQKLSNHLDIQFLTSYMLNQLEAQLTDAQREELRLRHIGAKALLCLPSSLRGDYSHLISTPHLVLEQLLMNMKCDLAGQVFQKVKNDFMHLKTTSFRYTVEQFNHLLETYAAKAVEVTVVQTLESEKERSQSACSGSSGKTDDVDGFMQRNIGDTVRGKRREGAVSPKPPLSVPVVASPRRRSLSSSPHVPPPPPVAPTKFIMPPHPPPRDQWVPDSAASTCMVCKEERFSMFNRRHHCRRCGRVVCASCSTKRTIIDGESARTCNDCYEQRFSSSESKSQAEQEFYNQRIREKLSGASPGSSMYGSTPSSVTSPGGSSRHFENMPEDNWVLRNDDKYDETVREEFYYEQAPSVSLCISILSHHSNRKECGQQILNMCDHLSEFLQPIAPGIPNPEVDYGLVISMILQLLFQAKMRFLKAGENQGVGLCDMYQSRVDLLKILVAANYKDLPSIKELTKMDTVRRLRDKLIEDERLPLAMEVSTKCGLETNGVWGAWGKACLHMGDYTAAREKFSHCLKCPNDKNQSSPSSRLLQDIVDYLESMPITGSTEIQMLLSSPASIKTLVTLPSASHSEEGSIETAQFQECLYYLRSYGTYLEHLAFLRRNGYWMKAAQYVSSHRCSTEVFVEGLLKPALTSGELGKLLDQMLMLDATLDKWSPYLTAACKHLLKNRLFNSLYLVQVFMKDFIRAAMTCLHHFYQRGAQSYLDLSARLHFLFTAQQHMQSFLDPQRWGSVRHPNSSPSIKKGLDWSGQSTESAVRLVMTPEEVTKHIRTIALQIEVTKFLEQCLTNQEADSTALAASYVVESQASNLPTLFGNSKVRTDLVSMILLSGNDITISFDLAMRIIKECHLMSTSIFTHTAREMAKHQHYKMIRLLLGRVEMSGLGTDDTVDEIIRASLLVVADKESETKEVDNLIKLLRKDSNKINAYILCGKLRSAYLLAVKHERVEDVQRIAGAAQRMNQAAVRNICNKWLQQRK